MDEILDVTLSVAEALDGLGVPYVVGGSLASSFHVFVARDDDTAHQQLERGRPTVVTDTPERTLRIASAEDTTAHKLYWYAPGDEVADRQWSDAVGVLKVAGERLDLAYLRRIVADFGVEDLLRRALEASGLESQSRG